MPPKLVFINGCFDIPHVGHVTLLERARAFGDRLVVGLNDDATVAALKGAGRPIYTFRERMTILLGLESVDDVVAQTDLTPCNLIRRLRPAVVVKGDDYRGRTLVEQPAIDEVGAELLLIETGYPYHGADIVDRMRDAGLLAD